MLLLNGKKSIGILTLLLWLSVVSVSGQSQETSIGVSLKPGLATNYAENNTDDQPFFAKTGGITVNNRFGEYIGLRTGFYYMERGKASELLFTDNDNNIRSVFSKDINRYLMVPLNVTFFSGQFFIEIGPNINYCLNRERVADKDLPNFIGLACRNDFAYGAQLHVGYDFKLSDSFRLGLEGYGNRLFEPGLINSGLGLNFRYVLN